MRVVFSPTKLLKMFKLLLGLSLVGFAVTLPTTKTKEDVRIVGGEDVDISEVPYQVSILYRGRHTCGGTIVAEDIIVTAAHCVVGSSPTNYEVRVGSSSNTEGGKVYAVGDLIWNPNFSYTKMDSDVALLWLKEPLEFNAKISPIELISEDEAIVDGDLTIVTGWGNIREGGGFPSTLQMVLVPTVNSAACDKAYMPMYHITPRMMCAGVPEGGKDACQGDSGGPLVHNNKLAGVVSWGIGCARPNYPGVYAKVSALRSWLDQNITFLRLKHVLRM